MLPVSAATPIWPNPGSQCTCRVPRASRRRRRTSPLSRVAWAPARFRWLPRVPIQPARRAAGGHVLYGGAPLCRCSTPPPAPLAVAARHVQQRVSPTLRYRLSVHPQPSRTRVGPYGSGREERAHPAQQPRQLNAQADHHLARCWPGCHPRPSREYEAQGANRPSPSRSPADKRAAYVPPRGVALTLGSEPPFPSAAPAPATSTHCSGAYDHGGASRTLEGLNLPGERLSARHAGLAHQIAERGRFAVNKPTLHADPMPRLLGGCARQRGAGRACGRVRASDRPVVRGCTLRARLAYPVE
jgi:hypothetical protein